MKQAFSELKEQMLENAEDIDEEELESKQSESREWLLLLLLGSFNFQEKFASIFTDMLTTYSSREVEKSLKEISKLGEFSLAAEEEKRLVDSIVKARLAFILPEIERSTFKMLNTAIRSAKDIKTVKKAISEAYVVNDERATTIEETEFVTARNATRVMLAEASGLVAGVLVSDGDGCAICPSIDGKVWSLDYASGNLLQHPHCVRSFTFLTADEVEDYGGINEGSESDLIEELGFVPRKNDSRIGPANSYLDVVGRNDTIKERKYFGQNGAIELGIHNTNHGNPKTHPIVPHAHDWVNGKPINARPLTPEEYIKNKDMFGGD